MAAGMLAGNFKSLDDLPANDWRRSNPRFTKESFEQAGALHPPCILCTTCKPGQAVPLDPTIWTGIKPKLLPKPVRKARSEYMSERREARQARKAKKVKAS